MLKFHPIALFPATLLLLLVSCNQSTTGVFAFIEAEQKIAEGNLGSARTVTSMAEDATRYFAAGGTVLSSRAKDGTVWSNLTVTTSGEVVQAVRSLASGGVYALVGVGAAAAVYHLSATIPSDVWTPVTLAGTGTPSNLVPVIDADGHSVVALLVVTAAAANFGQNYRYLSLLSDDTGVATSGDLGGDPATAVNAAIKTGGSFYLINRTTMWKTNTDLTNPVEVTGLPADSPGFSGLLAVSGSAGAALDGVYLATLRKTTTGGSVIKGTLSGTTWTAATALTGATDVKDAAGNALDLGPLLLPAAPASALSILVGTDKAGFAEISATALTIGSLNYARDSYASGAISTSPVLDFQVAVDLTLFVGTGVHGLWKYSASPAAWSVE